MPQRVHSQYEFGYTIGALLQAAACTYIFPHFHCSLYHRAVSTTDNLCTKKGNS